MLDLSRLRPFARISAWILLFLAAINFVLCLLSVVVPGWLPRQFFGVDFVKENRLRVVNAAAHYRDGLLEADKPLAVIIGLSSASEGIGLKTLDEEDGVSCRYLGLCGGGRNMEDIARYARPLLASDLKPDLVVLAISPFHLVDPPSGFRQGFVERLHHAFVPEILGLWFWTRRGDVSYALKLLLVDARMRMFQFFDVRLRETELDPWREMIKMDLPASVSEAALHAKIEQYGLRGYYDGEVYSRSHDQAATLIELIGQFRARRADLVIVLMPEHSALRGRMPTEAMKALLDPLKTLEGNMPPVFNFRDAIEDGGFMDISHMNDTGLAQFSSLLAKTVGQNVPNRRPMMELGVNESPASATSVRR